MTDEDAQNVRRRMDRDDLTALLYRFEGDKFCMASRAAAYHDRFGDRIDERILPDAAANPNPSPFFSVHIRSPHSVVTQHLIDREGEPTMQAVADIIDFLRRRLAV